MCTKALAVLATQRASGQGQQHLLTHHVLKQKTCLPIIPYFGLVLGNCAFPGLRIRILRPEQQIEIALQLHRHRLHAARAQNLKVTLVPRPNPDIVDRLLRPAMLHNQIRFALNRQRPNLPRIQRILDRAWRNLLTKLQRLILQIKRCNQHDIQPRTQRPAGQIFFVQIPHQPGRPASRLVLQQHMSVILSGVRRPRRTQSKDPDEAKPTSTSRTFPRQTHSHNPFNSSNFELVNKLLLNLSGPLLAAALFLHMAPAQVPDNALTRAIDPEIAAAIASIQAFDNHAHPVLPPPNDHTDRNFDALPVDNMEPETDIVAWRPDNPQLLEAWHALWGFDAPKLPLDEAGMKQLEAARQRIKTREATHFDEWLLDQASIATQAANRVSLGGPQSPGISPPRFVWVPYIDALLFPLDNSALAAATPDKKLFFPLEEKLRAQYLAASGLQAPPATLAEYLTKVVTPTLQRHKTNGAIAEKFEIAYLRSFDFSNPSLDEAARIYAKWQAKPNPDSADYKLLQDFLFRFIAQECGQLGMAVHLHTMSGGGGYFSIAGGNPMLLEPIFNDPALRKTKFVMLHGGWPFVREAGSLLQKPNVYLDLSQQALSFPPRTLAGWLREWLETFPDKVLFATDGYPFSDAMGWEESTWIASRNARQALGLALTGMVNDGEITRPRAAEIAAMVLHGNADALYQH